LFIFVRFYFQLAWPSKLNWTAICIHTSDITWGRSELLSIPSSWNPTRVLPLKQWPRLLGWQWSSLICEWLNFMLLSRQIFRVILHGSLHLIKLLCACRELSRFIAAGKLHCKIDKVAGVLETNRPDAKNALYQATIKQGDFLLNRIQKLSRVIDLWSR